MRRRKIEYSYTCWISSRFERKRPPPEVQVREGSRRINL
jgi:hypothetical protein